MSVECRYLVGIAGRNDPHTLWIALVLNGEVGWRERAWRSLEVRAAGFDCKEEEEEEEEVRHKMDVSVISAEMGCWNIFPEKKRFKEVCSEDKGLAGRDFIGLKRSNQKRREKKSARANFLGTACLTRLLYAFLCIAQI